MSAWTESGAAIVWSVSVARSKIATLLCKATSSRPRGTSAIEPTRSGMVHEVVLLPSLVQRRIAGARMSTQYRARSSADHKAHSPRMSVVSPTRSRTGISASPPVHDAILEGVQRDIHEQPDDADQNDSDVYHRDAEELGGVRDHESEAHLRAHELCRHDDGPAQRKRHFEAGKNLRQRAR